MASSLPLFVPSPSLVSPGGVLRPALRARAPPRRRRHHRHHHHHHHHHHAAPHCVAARSNASHTALTGRNGLPNARDLSCAAPPQLRANRVFRGAAPAALAGLPHESAGALLRGASLLLDLRSNDERALDEPSLVRAACGDDVQQRLQHVALLNKRRVVWGLARVLEPPQLFSLARRVASNPVRARRAVVRQVDTGGLLMLNRILVEAGGAQIARALRQVTKRAADERCGPVYVFCSAGKDRTGLLSALLLSLLGVARRDIVLDYARSDAMWRDEAASRLRVDYEQRLVLHGLSPAQWLGAPPEVMDETLSYINTRFGGVEDYLIACGFGEHEWRVLRAALCERSN